MPPLVAAPSPMVCLQGLPDLDNLPSDLEQLQAILEKEERRLQAFKDEERRRRQEKFRARKYKQRQQQIRMQQQQTRQGSQKEASQTNASPKPNEQREEAEVELVSLLDSVCAELTFAGQTGDLEALQHNLAVAEEVRAMEPELAKKSLVRHMQTARQKIEELEGVAKSVQGKQKAPTKCREGEQVRASSAAVVEAAETESDFDSCISEDMRIEAEICQLQLQLKQYETSEGRKPAREGKGDRPLDDGPDSISLGLKPCCSTLSFVTAESMAGDGGYATGGSTTASVCTSPTSCSSVAPAFPVFSEAAVAEAPPAKAPSKGADKGKGKGRDGGPASGPDPAKGKGKGKMPPPPPKSSGPRCPDAVAPQRKTNNLVHLHWKTSQQQENVEAMDEAFLQRLEDLCPHGCVDGEGEEPLNVIMPQRPATIFSPLATAKQPPQEVLDHYFAKCTVQSSWVPLACSTREREGQESHKNMLDEKRLNMLGILLQKHLMEHKGLTTGEAILDIKRGVLRCDSSVVRLEGLSVIRTVLRQHEKDNRPVCAFVAVRGEAALDCLGCPDHHRLVYELCKVPQIDERLECMLFCITFRESLSTCQRSLKALRQALDMLNDKRDTIRRFFVTAHRLGQSLNRQSNAPQAPHGFQLSTLEKLAQTKSTKFPKMSILHFVLALMSREDARALFNAEEVALLQSAKVLKTHKVFQDCVELAQSIYGVQQICETGKYTSLESGQAVKIERRRKTLPPHHSEVEMVEPMVDPNDRFHEVMQEFIDSNLEDAEEMAEGAFNVILTYKELALFFDDLPSVYPPPRNDTDPRQDLCDIFYRFAEDISKHREEVENEKLREIIAARNSELPSAQADPRRARSASSHYRNSPGPNSPQGNRGLPPQLPMASPPRMGSSRRCAGSPLTAGKEAPGHVPPVLPHELHFTPKSEPDSSGKSLVSFSDVPALPSFHMTPRGAFHSSHVDRVVTSEIDLLERTLQRAESTAAIPANDDGPVG